MTTAYVAFGANQGRPEHTYKAAATALQQSSSIDAVRASPLYRTIPVGVPQREANRSKTTAQFFNGALALETTLRPAELFALLRATEDRFGRVRETHWGDRTIDLDLVLFGDQVIEEHGFTVPHPRMHYRRFVLAPLANLHRDARHPVIGLSVGRLLQRMDPARLKVMLVNAEPDQIAIARELGRGIVGLSENSIIEAPPGLMPIVSILHGASVVGIRCRVADVVRVGVDAGFTMAVILGSIPALGMPDPTWASRTAEESADWVVLPAVGMDVRPAEPASTIDPLRHYFESILPVVGIV